MRIQLGLFHHVGEATEAPPVVGHCATAMRNEEFECGEIFEQIAFEQLHERGGVRIQIMRASGVKAGVAARAHMDHRRQIVFDHLFVDGIPLLMGQGRGSPVATAGIRIEVDAHSAIFLDAFF